MQRKLLTHATYFKYFNFNEEATGCGFEREPGASMDYFLVQTYLPIGFFNSDNALEAQSDYVKQQVANITHDIYIKLELIKVEVVEEKEFFIFKPWVLNIENFNLFDFFENFVLLFPSTLFYNLIERQVFLEELEKESFQFVRVLQDIPQNNFQRFGLDKKNVSRYGETSNLIISRIDKIDENEISRFYAQNWEDLPSTIKHKYFRQEFNTWFRITLKNENKTVGFVRLYSSDSSFNGSISLEYIIDKTHRKKGYATEAASYIIDYLRKYSYAVSIGGEVNDGNEYSIKVLKKVGFSERESLGPNSDNFYLSLQNN